MSKAKHKPKFMVGQVVRVDLYTDCYERIVSRQWVDPEKISTPPHWMTRVPDAPCWVYRMGKSLADTGRFEHELRYLNQSEVGPLYKKRERGE